MPSQLSIMNSFDERIELDEAGSYIKYFPGYLDANKADEILKKLLNDKETDNLIIGTLMHEAMASQIIAIGVILLILKDVSLK